MRTSLQFWLMWAVLCLNVRHRHHRRRLAHATGDLRRQAIRRSVVGFGQFNEAQKAQAALVGAAFVGLFSLFNIAGRFFWASLSDKIGRKLTYYTFFTVGFICYAAAPTLATLGMLGLFAGAAARTHSFI
jgi:MFS family permease